MKDGMHDLILQSAGVMGVICSAVHGWLGQTRILAKVEGLPSVLKRVNAGVFHTSTIYWFAGAIALIAAPQFPSPIRVVTAYSVAGIYLVGVAVNGWATRGRHVGALMFAIVAILAIVGA